MRQRRGYGVKLAGRIEGDNDNEHGSGRRAAQILLEGVKPSPGDTEAKTRVSLSLQYASGSHGYSFIELLFGVMYLN